MKSQTGIIMSLGLDSVYNLSLKQKLNTESSKGVELVAANNAIPQIFWTAYFLMAQRYIPEQSILFEDNKSAILLEQNGILSERKRTRHINIQYFFIRDCVSSRKIKN